MFNKPGIIDKESELEELTKRFERDSSGVSLKVFQNFGEGCPLRLRFNVYEGCSFCCNYCYIDCKPKAYRKRVKLLQKDAELAASLGLRRLPVMISCSSDPFQPIENDLHYTEKSLTILSGLGFPIIIMTQNPEMLLKKKYLDIISNDKTIVEVTIPSLFKKGFFKSTAPDAEKKFKALASLKKESIRFRVRIDPLFPQIGKDFGQSKQELRTIVEKSAEVGVEMIISKTLILDDDMKPAIKNKLKDFYNQNSILRKTHEKGTDVYVLKKEIQEELLLPVYEACHDFDIPFCSCTSLAKFPDTVKCNFP